ncbi:MAG: permease [Thermoplasmata archaeon]|nr:permease [Thermoplasmata archaeon]
MFAGAWDFIQDQVLGMRWLNEAVGLALEALGVDTADRIGASIQFFLYDTVKILILLVVLIFVVSYIQSYFPPERARRVLGGLRGVRGNTAGALLGTVTPFCSCSSIPIFIGFSKAGLPLGVTLSFLISSPFVDLAALIVLMGVFGPEMAVLYVVTGIVLAVAGGTVIERMGMEDQIEEFARPDGSAAAEAGGDGAMDVRERCSFAASETRRTVGRVWKYILVGVLVGALIHNWIPEDAVQAVLGDGNPLSVVIATLIGVPIYADIFGTIPIAEALLAKGVGAGTIMAFMMGVTAMSLPSIMMLRSVMKPRLLAVFFSVVVAGIVVIGYAFNLVSAVWSRSTCSEGRNRRARRCRTTGTSSSSGRDAGAARPCWRTRRRPSAGRDPG